MTKSFPNFLQFLSAPQRFYQLALICFILVVRPTNSTLIKTPAAVSSRKIKAVISSLHGNHIAPNGRQIKLAISPLKMQSQTSSSCCKEPDIFSWKAWRPELQLALHQVATKMTPDSVSQFRISTQTTVNTFFLCVLEELTDLEAYFDRLLAQIRNCLCDAPKQVKEDICRLQK